MMEIFRQWLISVTATTIIIALADGLMPKGAVKQVGKLILGMLMLVMIVKPVVYFSPETLESFMFVWGDGLEEEKTEQRDSYNEQLKTIIETELAAYIVDKAKTEGISCNAVVYCALGEDGVYLPKSVEIEGVEINDRFQGSIAEDLGLDVTRIVFKEVAHENFADSPNS